VTDIITYVTYIITYVTNIITYVAKPLRHKMATGFQEITNILYLQSLLLYVRERIAHSLEILPCRTIGIS
jgi:hypothetical protein